MRCNYQEVSQDWHRLDTSHGTFFGYTKEEVFSKARLDLAVDGIAQRERARELKLNAATRSPMRA